MNNLSERITDGRFLESGDRGVLAGAKLAEYLSLKVNDSLVLISQGYHGASAAGIYPVIGVVDLPVPDLNANVVYMPLEEAQWFFAMPGRVTSLAVMIDDADKLGEVKAEAGDIFSGDYVVLDWKEMLPELVQFIQIDNAGGVIMLGILYLVIGFGIFGTVMMMSAERKREFAVLISIGMKKWRLNLMVFLETVIIGLMGSIAGMLFSIPLLLYMKGHPIKLTGDVAEMMIRYGFEPLIPFLVEPSIFINQTLTVLAISILASLYPLWSTEKIKVSDVLRA
ncbi:MAG TPA: FtsX-like permease family protein [Chitinispirillaceae bacterium]|nr:FtsX-like permease family protein [Chitinispirillaceae bacterium]